jgi:hypothetical protein
MSLVKETVPRVFSAISSIGGQERKVARFYPNPRRDADRLIGSLRNTLSIIIQNARVRVVRIVSPVKRDYRVAGRGGDPGGVAEGILKLSNRISG